MVIVELSVYLHYLFLMVYIHHAVEFIKFINDFGCYKTYKFWFGCSSLQGGK